MIREINASALVEMLVSGANNLINNRQKVDDMNVFPVPDGDTGTNMSMTMKSCVAGIRAAADTTVSQVANSLANDTLRGARGNSGVILSQLMRGFKKAFSGAVTCDVKLMAQAFKAAADYAYRAVMKPTEGTILTVAREMAECAVVYAHEFEDFEDFMALVTDTGNKALASTPDLLPKLKQAGVVDAGGQGLMYIIEGMYYFVSKGKIVELAEPGDGTSASSSSASTEAEDIRFGYCTECIVDKFEKGKSAFAFKATIEKIGDSMVVVDDDDIIKVHIHTNDPHIVLGEALKIGSLASVKIENMRLQHNDFVAQDKSASEQEIPGPETEYAFICVAAGDGISASLKEIGVNFVIEGGQTMNPSTDDILGAIKSVNGRNVFVFPNNKNIIMAAQQAAQLAGDNVFVVPTTSVTQSMSCMLAFDEDADAQTNFAAFEEVISGVKSAQITNAVRDTNVDGVEIKEGDYLCIVDGKIKSAEAASDLAVIVALENMVDDDTATISVFYGCELNEDDASLLSEMLEDKYPDCDIYINYGGQPVYHYLISVE